MQGKQRKAALLGTSKIPAPSGKQVIDTDIFLLRPWPNHARVHSLRQLKMLQRSFERFGFVNPVLVDRENRVIAGWGRVQAAKRLGLPTVPTLLVDHLSAEYLREYVIADNRLAEKAGWDRSLLALELGSLSEIGIDFEAIGFETAEVDILLEEAAEANGQDGDDDQVPDVPARATTKPGDIWFCGEHRVICADAREPATYSCLLGEERAIFAFTDPPYNVQIDGHVSGLGRHRHREFAMASGEMSSEQFRKFLEVCLHNMAAYSANGAVHQICMDWRHASNILSAGGSVYSKLLNICIWRKTNAGMGSYYRSQHEMIFVWLNGSGTHVNNIELGRHGRSRSNVWDYRGVNTFKQGRDEELAMHPTVKPVAMVADCIKDCSPRGAIVLDAFHGSGTSMIAAEKTGRKARGIEIDPLYVDVAIQRWQDYSGKSAIHAETKLTFEQRGERPSRVRLKAVGTCQSTTSRLVRSKVIPTTTRN